MAYSQNYKFQFCCFYIILRKSKDKWECISFNPSVKFTIGKLNIPEPTDYKIETLDIIDVILVPLWFLIDLEIELAMAKGYTTKY